MSNAMTMNDLIVCCIYRFVTLTTDYSGGGGDQREGVLLNVSPRLLGLIHEALHYTRHPSRVESCRKLQKIDANNEHHGI